MPTYTVLIGCQNDVTRARFEPGDTATENDFTAEVIHNWVEIGVLVAVEPPAPADGEASDARQK